MFLVQKMATYSLKSPDVLLYFHGSFLSDVREVGMDSSGIFCIHLYVESNPLSEFVA